MRNRILRRLLPLIFIAGDPASPARAAPEPARESVPDRLEPALERALGFLGSQQRPSGSFDPGSTNSPASGLALLAFLSAGQAPDVGRHGPAVRDVINHLLSIDPEAGYLGKGAADNEGMASHCLATVALAQAHGLEMDELQRRRVRAALEKSLLLLYSAQDVCKDPASEGGWRHSPTSGDSDLASTTWAILALVACRDAGLNVPPARLDRALQYVLRCYRARERGFAYTPSDAASTPTTGAALLSLALLRQTDRSEFGAAAEYLSDKPIKTNQRFYSDALLLSTLGAFQAGGKAWTITWKAASDQLLASQRKEDGSWASRQGDPSAEGDRARIYPTAASILTLATPLRLLPVFQK